MSKATHDLLILNNESNESKTYMEAKKKFQDSDLRELLIDGEDTPDTILDTGFEIGFWAAVEVLTGYTDSYGLRDKISGYQE